jgi:hypothetical protein
LRSNLMVKVKYSVTLASLAVRDPRGLQQRPEEYPK